MKQTTGNSWCRIAEEITKDTRERIIGQLGTGGKWIKFQNVDGAEYLIASDNISHLGFVENTD